MENPIDRRAMGAAILSALQWIRERLRDKGDDWLDHEDDPFLSTVVGRCYIQIVTTKTETGRSRMTYRTLLTVFEGIWNALYVERLTMEACSRIHVAGLLAGVVFKFLEMLVRLNRE
ncbi:MAG: hypothetical protein LQ348_003629 [Seirophora lacunosa]|nr:MAG: hypothetical protein LQ348_003629 [Seirophora lacunosa]